MRSKALRIISLILSLVIVLSCWGCSSKKDNDSDDGEKKNKNDKDVTETVDNENDGEVDFDGGFDEELTEEKVPEAELTKFDVRNVYEFIDGYSMILTEAVASDLKLYSFVDTTGKVLGYINNVDTLKYLGTKMGKFYFYDTADNKHIVRCFGTNGVEEFAVDFTDSSNDTKYYEPSFNQMDGSTVLTRKVNAYENAGIQTALIDSDGKFISEFFTISVEGLTFNDCSFIFNAGSNLSVMTLDAVRYNGVIIDYDTKQITHVSDRQVYCQSDCYNGMLFFVMNSVYYSYNKNDGSITEIDSSAKYNYINDGLFFYNDGLREAYIFDSFKNVVADLSGYATRHLSVKPFVNGKAIIRFDDASTGMTTDKDFYLTAIDKTGNELFTPVYSGGVFYTYYGDGNNIITVGAGDYKVIDYSGNVIIEGKVDDIDDNNFDENATVHNDRNYLMNDDNDVIKDGFIPVRRSTKSANSKQLGNYYLLDGTLLFKNDEISFAVKAEDLQVNN